MLTPPVTPEAVAEWKPDTSFLPKLFARRLSRASRMALFAGYHALASGQGIRPISSIFCSRYGEFDHTYRIIKAIFAQEMVSPMDFSHSVYNTAQGLFSLLTQDKSPSVTVSGQDDALENAMVKVATMLHHGEREVLLVYHDDALPSAYQSLLQEAVEPLAFGMVIHGEPAPEALHCRIEFTAKATTSTAPVYHNQHAHQVAHLLIQGQGSVTLQTPRLVWKWEINAA